MVPDSHQPKRNIASLGKARPPFNFCYPLGLEPISEAFASYEGFDRLVLTFSTRSPLLQSHWSIPGYPVIRAIYTNYPVYTPLHQSIRPSHQGGAKWHLEVLIVPKEKRLDLQPRIITEGLPLLLEWMTGPDAPSPEVRRASVELWWFEDTQVLKLHIPKDSGDVK